jgi:hypothetical protein
VRAAQVDDEADANVVVHVAVCVREVGWAAAAGRDGVTQCRGGIEER